MRTQLFIFLCFLLMSLASCTAERIPFLQEDGTTLGNIRTKRSDARLEVNIPPAFALANEGQGTGEESRIVRLSMHNPLSELRIDILDSEGGLLSSKLLSPAPNSLGSFLHYEFSLPPDSARLRIQNTVQSVETTQVEVPELISLQELSEFSGFEVGNYSLTISETSTYRQSIQTNFGQDNRTTVVQELDFGSSFELHNFLQTSEGSSNAHAIASTGVLEIEYMYSIPNEQVAHGHSHGESENAQSVNFVPARAVIELHSAEGAVQSWDLRLRPGTNSVYLYPDQFVGTPQSLRFVHFSVHGRLVAVRELRIEAANTERLLERGAAPSVDSGPLSALPVDLGSLQSYSPVFWRGPDFELFRWNLFPQVYIFDFANLAVQGRFLRRLAFFVEKTGYVGRLLSNAELSGLHGWNAHNYHSSDLVRFFNVAAEQNFVLNAEEELLLNILLYNGILQTTGAGVYEEGEGQIISVTQEPGQSDATRQLLLSHEAYHGVFYNDADFRDISSSLWQALNEDVQNYLGAYFEYLQYDISNDYLLVNEFQAYMLHQDRRELPWVVRDRMAERIIRWDSRRANFINNTRARAQEELVSAAFVLEDYLYHKHGFVAGDLRCLVAIF